MLKHLRITIAICLFFLLVSLTVYGSNDGDNAEKKFTISGYVKDADTGENLTGATVYVREKATGTTSNSYGFYSISLDPGSYHITYTFLGYFPQEITVNVEKDITLDISLAPATEELHEVTVSSLREDKNIFSTDGGGEAAEQGYKKSACVNGRVRLD